MIQFHTQATWNISFVTGVPEIVISQHCGSMGKEGELN
jgi:hypothetical protein